MKLKIWHYYWVRIPYWKNQKWYDKIRLCILYQDAGQDAVFLPLTTNQDLNGKKIRNANKFEVESFVNKKHGLIKVNQPITISKQCVIIKQNFKPILVSTNTTRSIQVAWNQLMVWPIIK